MASTRVRLMGWLAAGTFALAGCTDEPVDESRAPAPTTADQSAVTRQAPPDDDAVQTTAAGPTAAELDDQGQLNAAEAVEEAWAMIDRTRQDPELEVGELARVARGQAVAQWVSNLQMARKEGMIQSGDTKVTITGVETISEGEEYEVTACLDWSEVKFNDVKPDRGELGDRQQITYVVRPDAGSPELFVTDDPLEYEACDD
ncbi:hypothetical protein DV701_07695 [Ornithinimicrobium avium]|uniref:Lipoprotein n=2 Tax=Ornithinimicrobium avium TaxID=2283195 RepID=A0A345NLW7_9MICO|nr:hypothetical protein DV701_07695 [Ornithinimicrobium avium]